MTLPSTGTTPPRPLFGGAIEAWIPDSFLDASTLRQVPDNQEVFVDSNTEQSLIVEILEMVSTESEFARYHFLQLAEDNDASDQSHHEILSVETLQPSNITDSSFSTLPPSSSIQILCGRQFVSKYRSDRYSRNTVIIYLAVIRLPEVSSDILISFNHPIKEDSDPNTSVPTQQPSSTTALRLPQLSSSADIGSVDEGFERFRCVVKSFRIFDMTLFGDS